jgi:biotin transport system substrate-specific component
MSSRTLALPNQTAARSLAARLGLALAFAAATAAAAQLRIPLPFTPVPITGQTAVVLLSGAVLGSAWGSTSMALYLLVGLLGAPIFADGEAGPAVLLGATGGYLLAFVLVPAVVGRALGPRSGSARAFLILLAASGIILLWGMLQLALVLNLSLARAFLLGVAPFLIGDVVKVAVAAAAFRVSRPLAQQLRA